MAERWRPTSSWARCSTHRRPRPGGDAPGFDTSAWSPVSVGGNEVNPVIETHPGPPVRVVSEFRAKTITSPKPGVHVLDLGQNFAGVVRLTVAGKPGQTITLRYAERLNPDGTIYTTNLRSARTTDTYTCKGGGVETWVPRFTFHGFQYVEVTGLDAPPTPETVVGLALSSDTSIAGSFECSDPMLNQLHSNIVWGQRGNFLSIPTDCPQRDERLGWTGDAQIYIRTATLQHGRLAPSSPSGCRDLEDAQRARRAFTDGRAGRGAAGGGTAAWADAGVICPWTIYRVYGDTRILHERYQSAKKWISYLETNSKDLLRPAQGYGDWIAIGADTPKDVLATAYFAHATSIVASWASVIGQHADAEKYRDLFERIKVAFNTAYVSADGRIKGDTQAVYVLAIAFDLVQGEKASLAAKYLVEDIESRDNHLSTGFIGTKDLMLALAKAGRNDVAYRLLHNDTFPSWGFSIKHGATSIWERWNGWTPEQGFGDPGMNSFAHYSFGAVYQWMVENIGGIHNAGDAYRRIRLAPQPGGKLTWAKTRFDSIHGPIESNWRVADGRLTLEIAIPANTSATVVVPGEKGAPREVGPGRHTFSAAYP
jgi:alpha-L-rhamnosidase